jgi:uncharacterized membrane protein
MSAMTFLRFLMLLALVVWLGGLIFFAFVEAPGAFAVLPTRHLAGNVVARSIAALHWMGIVSGLVFLVGSMLYSRLNTGSAHAFAGRNVLIVLMLVLTLISQFRIIPRMDTLRTSIGEIDSVPPDNPARMQFDGLHVWSTRVEGGVLLLGLTVLLVTAKQLCAT